MLTGFALCLLDFEQLDLENERRVGRNHRRKAPRSVAEVRRDGELAERAHLHARHALIPALDDLACAEPEREALLRSRELSNFCRW